MGGEAENATCSTRSRSVKNRAVPIQEEKETNKEMIENFLLENFGIKKVRFGANGHGLAKPGKLFYQYPNQCNGTVSLGIFWAGVGYTRIPRFSASIERAIFCKLQRSLMEDVKPEIARRVLDEEKLTAAVMKFIHS